MANNLGYYITDDEGYPKSSKPVEDLETVKPIEELDTGVTSNKSSTPPKSVEGAIIKAGIELFQGYMQAEAIVNRADYEADIMQLNADLGMYEAGEQLGVDYSKILRYSEQVDEVTGKIRAQFIQNDQEGGAAQDLIAENTLQGKLNQLAMMNEAQSRVANATFASKLSYLRAQQKRKISEQQAKQAITAGYLGAVSGLV